MRNVVCAVVLLLVAAGGYAGSTRAAPPPTPWSQWTEIAGVRVHYLDTAPGSPLPAVLVLPGFLGSTETFESLAGALRPDLRVVVADFPGFGWSEATRRSCTVEDRLAFVEAFADALHLGPVFLVGSSMGTNIAVRYAVENPDRVRRLVLLSPFGLEEQREVVARLQRLDRWLPLVALFVTRRFVARELGRQVRDPAELTRDVLQSFVRPFRSAGGRRVVVGVSRNILYGSFFDGELPMVLQPTLAVAGSDDANRCREILATLGARMPSCTTQILAGCRHMIQLDAPEQVADLIAGFCAADPR